MLWRDLFCKSMSGSPTTELDAFGKDGLQTTSDGTFDEWDTGGERESENRCVEDPLVLSPRKGLRGSISSSYIYTAIRNRQ